MANKRLSLLLECDQLLEVDHVSQDPHAAKRYKSTLQQHQHASPISELSHTMRNTILNGGTPKSSKLLTYSNSISSSYASSASLDDEYLAMFELDEQELPPSSSSLDKLPSDLDALITGQLKTSPVRRCLSLEEINATPTRKKMMSMNDADILNALGDEPELIGDLSKPCALPVLHSGMRHSDLKTISCDTLARLLHGEFPELLENNYQIIDCRYPYEFDGGHIRGALNLYTREQIRAAFPAEPSATDHRRIYVFHCEFSSERGPKLMRFLRSNDRNMHAHNYPALDYPELYLLHNGYKEFHGRYSDLCDPSSYVPMLAPAYNEEYRLFRAKTKSWNCGDSVGAGDRCIDDSLGRSRVLRKSRSRLLYAE